MPSLEFSSVRPSPLAGMWYPARPDSLRASIENYLSTAEKQTTLPDHQPLGLLVPHAGLRFSGPVAAHSFLRIRARQFDTVVVVGPLHYQLPGLSASAGILTSGHVAYRTPFGDVDVDQEAIRALVDHISLTLVRDDPEHSIEIELPFLQHIVTPGFKLVPIMLRDQSAPSMERLGHALAHVMQNRNVLWVASSDLSHFYPQHIANQFDNKMLQAVQELDAEKVIAYDEAGVAFACGCGAIAAVIHAIKASQQPKARLARYATSGDVNGDYDQVVGYGAVTFA